MTDHIGLVTIYLHHSLRGIKTRIIPVIFILSFTINVQKTSTNGLQVKRTKKNLFVEN